MSTRCFPGRAVENHEAEYRSGADAEQQGAVEPELAEQARRRGERASRSGRLQVIVDHEGGDGAEGGGVGGSR